MSFIQAVNHFQSTALATNAVTISNQGSGDLNLAFFWLNGATTTISSVLSNNANTYSLIDSISNVTAAWAVACYAAFRINPGPDTITVNLSAAVTSNILVCEYQAVSAVDAHRSDNGTTQNPTSGNLTTLNQNDILVYFASMSSAETAPGAGYTLRMNAQAGTQLAEDKMVGVVGTYTGSYSNAAANNWSSILVALQIAPMPSNIWGGGFGGGISY